MRFIDTNLFVYIFTRSPKKDFEVAKNILERVQNGEEAATSNAVIYEAVDWLEYNHREKEVEGFLIALNSYLSLSKLSVHWENILPSLKDMRDNQLEFVDALTLQIMKEHGINEIYSNDKDFDRVDWVRRVWE